MAVDEALLATAADRETPVLRFYGWIAPALSIGYFQQHDACIRDGYEIVRRPTGGGVVNHAHDLTFTLVFPRHHWYAAEERFESYRLVNQSVVDSLRRLGVTAAMTDQDTTGTVDRATMQCFVTPTRYDVMAGPHKVAGGAQRRTANGILYQGSINLEHMPELDRQALLTSLEVGVADVFDCSFKPFEASLELDAAAAELVREKYGTSQWNKRR